MINDFQTLIRQIVPRALTQLCRDPDSADYGSWDRNYWHYKIRDFSSIILQQGGYLLAQAARLKEFEAKATYFKSLAPASVRFWHKRALKYGAFEEYYPFERSYPGLAFSTLAIAKIIRDLSLDPAPYHAGLRIAIGQLEARTEFAATNQYLAGLAALYVLSELVPDMVDKAQLDRRLRDVLASQSAEGWFNEYGGPDLGYLSVSIDCLWDIYDVSHSAEVLNSIRGAIGFIDALLIAPQSIGLHNSRQTDYLVPYGIIRMALMDDDPAQMAAISISQQLFAKLNDPEHFLQAIDDRYWVHYIGHSVLRAYGLLAELIGFDTSSCRKRQDDASTITHFPESGYIVIRKAQYSGLISTRKGGIISVYGAGGQRFADYGSNLYLGRKIFVMNWWGCSQLLSLDENTYTIEGSLVPTEEHISSPGKHLVLRIASLVFGAAIISALKQRLIFRQQTSPFTFTRTITMGEKEIRIVEATSCRLMVDATSCRIPVKARSCRFLRPRSTRDVSNPLLKKALAFSKRHVASANSYHSENVTTVKNCRVETTQEWINNELQQTTIIHL
jgi:hypothetical protein